MNKETFERELTSLINRYSKENQSNTPDFILANYIIRCLDAFSATTIERDMWWGTNEKIEEVFPSSPIIFKDIAVGTIL